MTLVASERLSVRELEAAARDHLLLHFPRMGGLAAAQGLLCRTDDRGDLVIQLSPPLIAGLAEFDEIAGILGDVLAEAEAELRSRGPRKGRR